MASGLHNSDIPNPVLRWIDQRMPVFTMMQKEYGSFPTPRNFNYFWNFGALAMVFIGSAISENGARPPSKQESPA